MTRSPKQRIDGAYVTIANALFDLDLNIEELKGVEAEITHGIRAAFKARIERQAERELTAKEQALYPVSRRQAFAIVAHGLASGLGQVYRDNWTGGRFQKDLVEDFDHAGCDPKCPFKVSLIS